MGPLIDRGVVPESQGLTIRLPWGQYQTLRMVARLHHRTITGEIQAALDAWHTDHALEIAMEVDRVEKA